jgi:phosphate-selective porin OprO/OprP
MLFIKKRFYAEAHYHQANVNTPEAVNADNFKASGFYAQMSWLLKGNQQNYNPATGLAAHPAPKSLEVLARFNTTKIEDASLNDISAEMNYFISKYLVARVLYVHTMVKDGPKLDLIQGRLQFSF